MPTIFIVSDIHTTHGICKYENTSCVNYQHDSDLIPHEDQHTTEYQASNQLLE